MGREENTSRKNLCRKVSLPRNALILLLLRLGSLLSVNKEMSAKIGIKMKRWGRSMIVIRYELISAHMIYHRLMIEKYNQNALPFV